MEDLHKICTVNLIPSVWPKKLKLLMFVLQISHLCIMKVFKKVQKNAYFSTQYVLDPLLSHNMYFFKPKVLPKDQLNLRGMKNY